MASGLSVNLNGDACWPDLARKDIIHLTETLIQVACLEGGMESGKPSVTIRIDLPSGEVLLVETSMALFLDAAAIMANAFGHHFPETVESTTPRPSRN